MRPDLLIVTDLDGTLLDARTYDWQPAAALLARLRGAGVPVVFCTSKTRAETQRLRTEIGNIDPYIVESGGALIDGDSVEVLGVAYARVRECFAEIRAAVPVRGFGDMTDDEVAVEADLSVDRAKLSRRREFDEPFTVLGDAAALLPVIEAAATRHGLRITRGGRYFHLHGPADKGTAVRRLRVHFPGRRFLGLGDSALDLPMLAECDDAVIIARPDGSHDPCLTANLPRARLAGAGPSGWAAAVETCPAVEALIGIDESARESIDAQDRPHASRAPDPR